NKRSTGQPDGRTTPSHVVVFWERNWGSRGVEGVIATAVDRLSAERLVQTTPEPMDTKMNHPAACMEYVCSAGCHGPTRVISNCTRSRPIFRGRVTVRTRFSRTLPITRELSFRLASPDDHHLPL